MADFFSLLQLPATGLATADHLNRSDDGHMSFGKCFFPLEAHCCATLPIYLGLGPAIFNC